jgi:general secretion pathway protein A
VLPASASHNPYSASGSGSGKPIKNRARGLIKKRDPAQTDGPVACQRIADGSAGWQTHIDSALSRPVLIIDEAQEMHPQVLSELRLLSSARLDSHVLLTVVLAGDGRLVERLRSDEFQPLDSRIRVRLPMERATPDVLQACLRHLLAEAGAPALMVPEVIATLADHAQGNLRSLMIMADELLAAAAERKAERINEALLFEACALAAQPKAAAGGRRR